MSFSRPAINSLLKMYLSARYFVLKRNIIIIIIIIKSQSVFLIVSVPV